nr:MAG TPA: hypothetical protein [Caudoviricetes sp.]DAY66521.1 MAG TPA: hypothetical protein [Caudoviricetes sp.]DAY86514.1 MAG TPA: hypothetical protein [Caudoviricetes sp.]
MSLSSLSIVSMIVLKKVVTSFAVSAESAYWLINPF